MPLQPGDPVFGGETTETRGAADGIEAGDPVALDGTDGMVAVDSEANEFGGVARHTGDNEGRGNAAVISGAVPAAVADGVTEGSRLNSGNTTGGTAGVLIEESGGPVKALSDEGGMWHSEEETYDVPDGYAVVQF